MSPTRKILPVVLYPGFASPKLYIVIISPVEYPALYIGGRATTVDVVESPEGMVLTSEYAVIFLSQGKTKDFPSFKIVFQYIPRFVLDKVESYSVKAQSAVV